MFRLKVKIGPVSYGLCPCGPTVNSLQLQLMDHSIARFSVRSVERLNGALSTGCDHMAGVFALHFKHTLVEVIACHSSLLNQVVVFYDLVLGSCEVSSHWVSHPCVKMTIGCNHRVFRTMINSA